MYINNILQAKNLLHLQNLLHTDAFLQLHALHTSLLLEAYFTEAISG